MRPSPRILVSAVGLCVAVIASCLFMVSSAGSRDNPSSTVRLVTAVFRHGQRTPASTYPTDPHINNDFFPTGWGALTNEGKMQQFKLGQFLRERYKDFLNEIYSPEYVIAQSTDVDRTKMSVQLVLAGLYPPVKSQQWNSELIWQPIPINYEPQKEDKLLLVTIPCPRYYEALQEITELENIKKQIEDNKDIYSYLTNNTGMEVKTFNDLLSVQGTLRAETDLNLTLPEWTAKVYPEPLTKLAARSFTLNSYTPELKRIKGGPLLKKILDDNVAKANNTMKQDRQLFIYGGHDSTVAYLLSALNVFDEQAPEYNSLVLIELHKLNENLHGIKVFLRNSTRHEPYLLKIPDCEEICPLEKVLDLTSNVIPSDLNKACIPKDPNYVPPEAPEI